jgi:ABC-2 type transport system permease protein
MLLLLNGLLAFGLWIVPLMEDGDRPPGFSAAALDVFLMWMSILTVLDVLFIIQGAIIGERQSGVAAWVLSGPVSRSAFILAKFIGNAIGLLLTTVVLQCLFAFAQVSMREGALLPITAVLATTGLQALYLLFYLALALMLGTLYCSRVPVMAISFGVLLGQPFVDYYAEGVASWLSWLLPAKLPELARFAHRGEPLPSYLPIFVALALSLGFLLLAIWRFKREEF